MGIFDPIKQLFIKERQSNEVNAFENLLNFAYAETQNNFSYYYDIILTRIPLTLEKLNQLSDADRIATLSYCLSTIPKHKNKSRYSYDDVDGTYGMKANVKRAFIKYFLRKKMHYEAENFLELIALIRARKDLVSYNTTFFPFGNLIKQLEYLLAKTEDSAVKQMLIDETEKITTDIENYGVKELSKISVKFANLRKENGLIDANTLFFFEPKDLFSLEVNSSFEQLPNDHQGFWSELLEICQKTNGSKPSKKFEVESKKRIQQIGSDAYKQQIYVLFAKIIAVKDGSLVNNSLYFNADPTATYINGFNSAIVKGLIWTCAQFHDEKTLLTIYELALRSFKKIPGIGQEATLLGNATLYTLYNSKGLVGIGLLTRLRLKVKHSSTLSIIQKYLEAAAESKGVSLSEIEDIATDDFKLVEEKRSITIVDCVAIIRVVGIGKCELVWTKDSGAEQKSVPAHIQSNYAEKVKKVKAIQKQIEQTLSAQRDRIDRLFRIDRTVSREHFTKYFVEHGLLSYIGKRLIWQASKETEQCSIFWFQNAWRMLDQTEVAIENFDQFKLWHPANETTSEVLNWRQFFMSHEIQQPIKQAFREVYILTPAEVNTRTYSNRMAAHILKQHQFVSLARARNWTASLQGNWDGGGNALAHLQIPEFKILAEFWTEGIYDNDSFNDNGILLYVSTDQIRFLNTETMESMDLIDVPTVVFSEVLRDTDLFVGVASIGNDPNWQDGGNQQGMAEYWQSYSFGELSEVAKNRKELLTNLIPKLKIANQCEVTDKFLIVKGKLRTYKIHLGSTNILMEPNDQYLCIVQDRSAQKVNKVFIPFDGDQGLSVIISKAILLAADDKITDQTILTQINR